MFNQTNFAMKTFIIFIGLLVLPAMIYYQKTVEIRGVVIDAESRLPMKDSHVYVSGTNVGVVTNENGEFLLNIPLQYMDNELIVSYVGYSKFEKKLVHIRPPEIQVIMKPDIIVLDEVIVTPQGYMLVEDAISKVSNAYQNSEEMMEDFYLALIKRDHDLVILKRVVGEENLYGY